MLATKRSASRNSRKLEDRYAKWEKTEKGQAPILSVELGISKRVVTLPN